MTDLDALQKLMDASTPGPWTLSADGKIMDVPTDSRYAYVIPRNIDDASFIVAMHSAMPALLAELRALRQIERAARDCWDENHDDLYGPLASLQIGLKNLDAVRAGSKP